MLYRQILLLFLLSISNTFQNQEFLQGQGQGPLFPSDYVDDFQDVSSFPFFSFSSSKFLSLAESSPNSCTNPYKSGVHWVGQGCNKLGQCNKYNCGPHSLHQVLTKFGIEDYDEYMLAKFAGTTDGTGHQGINDAVKKVNSLKGKKITIEWKNFSSFGSTVVERFTNLAKIICQPNKDVIIHSLYRDQWGHYETISGIDVKTQIVTVLNSLGQKASKGYLGYIEKRSFSDFARYMANTPYGQPAVAVLTNN